MTWGAMRAGYRVVPLAGWAQMVQLGRLQVVLGEWAARGVLPHKLPVLVQEPVGTLAALEVARAALGTSP